VRIERLTSRRGARSLYALLSPFLPSDLSDSVDHSLSIRCCGLESVSRTVLKRAPAVQMQMQVDAHA
jgi:hypothetical protein